MRSSFIQNNIMIKQKLHVFKSIYLEILPLRTFITLIFVVVLGSLMLGLFILHQFETASKFSLRHQGILIAKALEAGILPDILNNNTKGLQSSVDRFVSAQENDIEVNIMLLKEKNAYTVASNIEDNIEEADEDEYQDILSSIKIAKPLFFISKGEPSNEEDEDEKAIDGAPENGSYSFSDTRPFMSITAPIINQGKGLGCINIKLSLEPLEQKIKHMHHSVWIATCIEIILVVISLILLFNYFLIEKGKFQQEESTRLNAEIKALQAQINPHFLFNTLNTLANLILSDPSLAEQMTSNMASLFRSILNAGKKEWWPIEEEIKIIKNYLEIEAIRLCDKMKYRLDIPEKVLKIKIPCLLIQPLVENAIKHGITTSTNGGEIIVQIFLDQGLVFVVEDKRCPADKYPIAPNPVGEKTGIENIKKRLALFYKNKAKCELQIFKNGAKATIKILEYSNE